MDAMLILQSIFRWFHILAGIVWIGHLYFFNFVNAPLQAVLDGGVKKQVNPELLPRALFWFRWGAAWTWITGVLLLLLVFYHGGLMFDTPSGWTAGALIMVALVFVSPFIYDALVSIEALKNTRNAAIVGWVLTAVVVLLFIHVGGFGYRAYVIHVGAMFGTIMAFNVWFRIWPAQQVIIKAVKEGTPPPADKVALAGLRSRHNTYLSIPLVWAMIDMHTVVPFANSWIYLLVIVAAGWWLGTMLYRQAAKVKGF